MGISKRIFDLARANLNALLDQTGRETPIDEWTDAELEAELRRRRERRLRDERERQNRSMAEAAARKRASERIAQEKGRPAGTASEARGPQRSRGRAAGAPSVARLRELYAQLEVPYGAPFEEVKRSFRRLMRKYHPDLHVGNPVKHQAATKLTMSLTQAYDELEQHLVDR